MMCGKDRCISPLCPVSFGIAFGITMGLAVLVWMIWLIVYGVPPMMAAEHPVVIPTVGGAFLHALLGLAKGFVFGFVVALIYDMCICCCRSWRKGTENGGCGCGTNKSELGK